MPHSGDSSRAAAAIASERIAKRREEKLKEWSDAKEEREEDPQKRIKLLEAKGIRGGKKSRKAKRKSRKGKRKSRKIKRKSHKGKRK